MSAVWAVVVWIAFVGGGHAVARSQSEILGELDTIAKKLGYSHDYELREWTQDFRSRDFTKLPAAERERWLSASRLMDESMLIQDKSFTRRDDLVMEYDTAFLIRIKLQEPRALATLRHWFRQGYNWAHHARVLCEKAGDLFLIPIAAETLFIDQPEKEIEQHSDLVADPSPAICSAFTMGSLLRANPNLPKTVPIDEFETDQLWKRENLVPTYRRWWLANKEVIIKGDVKAITRVRQFEKP